MISLDIDGSKVDILPVVNGLVSEAERVKQEFGEYEAYSAALSIEGIQCLKNRANISDTFDVSELDLVYIKHMEQFGEVIIPSPAMYTFVDLVTSKGMQVIPLDMNDQDFTDMYCNTVGTLDFVKEHSVAKKGMKKDFKADDPVALALAWDAYVNNVKGYRELSKKREAYIAKEIKDICRYKKSLLAIIEVERAENVANLLR